MTYINHTSLHCLTSTPKWIWIQPNRNQRWCGGQLQDAETRTHQRLPKDSTLQQGADAEASPTNLDALDNRWLCRAVSGTRDTGLKWIEADVQICIRYVRSIFCSEVVSTWGSYFNIASSCARCLIALPCGLMSSCHVTHACLNSTTSLFFHVLPLSASILPYITRN